MRLILLPQSLDQVFHNEPRKRLGVLSLFCMLSLIYGAIFLPYLPLSSGLLGHDYALHFPNLLVGYYWALQNNYWSIPWFTPATCGGMAYYADLNVAYFSAPQVLTLFVSPLRAIQITFMLFAFIGMWGTYRLMRVAFGTSRTASVIAAALFLFNGFYAHRMLIGHLTFHAFALTPLLMAMLLPRAGKAIPAIGEALIRACIAGMCLGYMFHSGMIHAIPPVLMACAIVILIHGMRFGFQAWSWALLAGAGLLSLGLSAGKLYAALSLANAFPRDFYKLPGADNIAQLLWAVFSSVFWRPSPDVLVNSDWSQVRHEWEYGLTLAPVFIVYYIYRERMKNVLRLPSRGFVERTGLARGVAGVFIGILLLTPLALNFYAPGWNAFLKQLPYFSSSSSLLRFFCLYIPVIIVGVALAIDRKPRSDVQLRLKVALVALAVIIVQNAITNRDYYSAQTYDPSAIIAEYLRASNEATISPVNRIEAAGISSSPNDTLAHGGSALPCYQPMFGYRLEKFSLGQLQPGPIFSARESFLNFKNPACYLFPKENKCTPGDHFAVSQIEEAQALAAYRPFAFQQPASQILATNISIASSLACLFGLALGGFFWRRVRRLKTMLL